MSSITKIVAELRPLATPVETLREDGRNARTHSDRSVAAVASSLARYGQRKPLVVARDGMRVIAGNGTLRAAKLLGWTHVACVIVDDDPKSAAGYALADNRTAELSAWDFGVLAATLGELLEEGTGELAEHGLECAWTDADLERMLASAAPPPSEKEQTSSVTIECSKDEAREIDARLVAAQRAGESRAHALLRVLRSQA